MQRNRVGLGCVLAITCSTVAALLLTASAEATSGSERGVWVKQLEASLKELIDDERIDKSEKMHVVALVANGLALAGQIERALTVVNEHMEDERQRQVGLQNIADAQSTVGDLKGAYETATLIPEGFMRQRTLKLIAVRQSQQGDFDDAVNIIERISTNEERDAALALTVSELVESSLFRRSNQLANRIQDETIKANSLKRIRIASERPSPTDENYTDRMIVEICNARQVAPKEVQLLRCKFDAQAADARKDPVTRLRSLKAGESLANDLTTVPRVAALLSLAQLAKELGDADLARRLFRNSLAISREAIESHPFVLLCFVAEKRYVESITEMCRYDELEQWIQKVGSNPIAYPLVGMIVAAIAVDAPDRADAIYESLDDSNCKLYVAWSVLSFEAERAGSELN